MIVPNVPFNSQLDVNELSDQLVYWSLFGQVALTNVPAGVGGDLDVILRRVGGRVDLLIELEQPIESEALALLNAGAHQIMSRGAMPELIEIPEDRIRIFADDGSPDEAIPRNLMVSLTTPTAERIAELEMARVDCLVESSQLTPRLITDFLKQVLVTDRPDGLWSTLIVDPLGIALGLAYSNEESVLHAIENRCGTYWSRSRNGLWIKGETSGATQHLLGIRMDCDRDCLRFMVTQDPPGFCHLDTHTCFGQERSIVSVMNRLSERIQASDENSFTRKLASDPQMLESKLVEEAKELADANQQSDDDEVAWEAADVLYFTLVAMLKNGISLNRVYHELARRMNRVVRRPPGIKDQSP